MDMLRRIGKQPKESVKSVPKEKKRLPVYGGKDLRNRKVLSRE